MPPQREQQKFIVRCLARPLVFVFPWTCYVSSRLRLQGTRVVTWGGGQVCGDENVWQAGICVCIYIYICIIGAGYTVVIYHRGDSFIYGDGSKEGLRTEKTSRKYIVMLLTCFEKGRQSFWLLQCLAALIMDQVSFVLWAVDTEEKGWIFHRGVKR